MDNFIREFSSLQVTPENWFFHNKDAPAGMRISASFFP
jgi:hypothetical protein